MFYFVHLKELVRTVAPRIFISFVNTKVLNLVVEVIKVGVIICVYVGDIPFVFIHG